jgi:hypothetical protein
LLEVLEVLDIVGSVIVEFRNLKIIVFLLFN